jgi:hypothetical protein
MDRDPDRDDRALHTTGSADLGDGPRDRAMAVLPYVGVAIYWLVFVIRMVLDERSHVPPDAP